MLENSIELFLRQDHEDKTLLIYDDLGTVEAVLDQDNIIIISNSKRSPNVGAKYNLMMNLAQNYDAVAVWDDDDTYLPNHLSVHAEVLQNSLWSKPSTIVSAHFSPPREEDASGRFHGSIAIRLDLLNYIKKQTGEMWVDTKRATFDQEMLKKLSLFGTCGDPCSVAPPTYVYRWQTSGGGHCSGLMGDNDWYDKYQPDSTTPITTLNPKLDNDSIRLLQLLSPQRQ